jgi:hypothetical protein
VSCLYTFAYGNVVNVEHLKVNIPAVLSQYETTIPTNIYYNNLLLLLLLSSSSHMGDRRGAYRFLVGKPEGKRPHGRPRHRWIILKWIFRKWDVGVWTGLIWLRIGTCGGML